MSLTTATDNISRRDLEPEPELLGTRFVGFCGPRWRDGDVVGHLLMETQDGWVQAGSHMSSGVGYSQVDIRRHFDRRENPSDNDTYEWIGQQLDIAAVADKYPPAVVKESLTTEAAANG